MGPSGHHEDVALLWRIYKCRGGFGGGGSGCSGEGEGGQWDGGLTGVVMGEVGEVARF